MHDDLPILEPGTVWLAGAGPGDPGLLTRLAFAGLQQADVVVHDALVDQRILRLAASETLLEAAGKRGGRPSATQADISERLVILARQGRRVLRHKGGDPFVFGRGGEEALALTMAGIKFRVVPGITAGIGGLAYAGIPVTHRAIGQAVTFVTGHELGGNLPETLDWALLARVPLLVCYMARTQLHAISGRLIAQGRPGADPVAIISNATRPEQKIVLTTLEHVAADALSASVETPALLAVGAVVELGRALQWFPGVVIDQAGR